MRKIISLILYLISLPAAAQIIPPRYAGSDDPDVFRKQFEKKVTKVMKRDGYRIEELSHELLMKFTIDTLGRCVDVQYPDSLGGVRFNPTQRSRELLNTALSELNPFTPAYKDGRKIPYVRKMLINMNFLPGAIWRPLPAMASIISAMPRQKIVTNCVNRCCKAWDGCCCAYGPWIGG
jgi:hypothetical protein